VRRRIVSCLGQKRTAKIIGSLHGCATDEHRNADGGIVDAKLNRMRRQKTYTGSRRLAPEEQLREPITSGDDHEDFDDSGVLNGDLKRVCRMRNKLTR
jgi:hypothetical protein